MAITLARLDDRVIHGQTVTRWATQRPCNAILIISDAVANDELRKKVMKGVASHLKLGIYTVDQGIAALEKAKESKNNFFIISDNVHYFAEIVRKGGDFGKTLNVGNITIDRPGIKNLGNAVVINEGDVAEFDYLESQGIKIEFQMIPDDGIKDWAYYRAKFFAS